MSPTYATVTSQRLGALAAWARGVMGDMHARDIPVLGDLIDAAFIFAVTLGRIGRHPFGFVHAISFDGPMAPRRAFKFIGAGIAFAYLIISPALSKHSFEISELRFGVVVLLRLLLVTAIYHAAFLIVGYRRPITTSLILSSYINGVYFPFFMATMLPGYLAIGPQYYFEPLGGALTPEQVSALDHPLVLSAQVLLLVAYPFFFALASYWWATAYGTRVWLSAVLLFAAIILAGLGNLYAIPLVTRLLP